MHAKAAGIVGLAGEVDPAKDYAYAFTARLAEGLKHRYPKNVEDGAPIPAPTMLDCPFLRGTMTALQKVQRLGSNDYTALMGLVSLSHWTHFSLDILRKSTYRTLPRTISQIF